MSYSYERTPRRERTKVLVGVNLPRAHYLALEQLGECSVPEHVKRAVAVYLEQRQQRKVGAA